MRAVLSVVIRIRRQEPAEPSALRRDDVSPHAKLHHQHLPNRITDTNQCCPPGCPPKAPRSPRTLKDSIRPPSPAPSPPPGPLGPPVSPVSLALSPSHLSLPPGSLPPLPVSPVSLPVSLSHLSPSPRLSLSPHLSLPPCLSLSSLPVLRLSVPPPTLCIWRLYARDPRRDPPPEVCPHTRFCAPVPAGHCPAGRGHTPIHTRPPRCGRAAPAGRNPAIALVPGSPSTAHPVHQRGRPSPPGTCFTLTHIPAAWLTPPPARRSPAICDEPEAVFSEPGRSLQSWPSDSRDGEP